MIESLSQHLDAADKRVDHCEALLHTTTEQHAENAKAMMMEMSDQLAQESERLLFERKKHERMYAEMLVQVGELQKLLSAQRTEAAGRFAEVVKSKDLDSLKDLIIEGEKIVARIKQTLIPREEGKPTVYHITSIYRVRNQQVVETWSSFYPNVNYLKND